MNWQKNGQIWLKTLFSKGSFIECSLSVWPTNFDSFEFWTNVSRRHQPQRFPANILKESLEKSQLENDKTQSNYENINISFMYNQKISKFQNFDFQIYRYESASLSKKTYIKKPLRVSLSNPNQLISTWLYQTNWTSLIKKSVAYLSLSLPPSSSQLTQYFTQAARKMTHTKKKCLKNSFFPQSLNKSINSRRRSICVKSNTYLSESRKNEVREKKN